MGYAALIQMLMQLAGSASESNAKIGHAMGAGGDENKWNELSSKATKFKDPVVSGIAGYLGGRRDKKLRRRKQAEIERVRKITEALQQRGLAQQEGLTRLSTQQQLSGYDVARKEAERLGRSSKQGALDTGQQLGAQLSQDLTNRGLGSTTVGANLQRGISADTSRTIGGINEGLAQMFGNIAMGRAGAEAQGTQQLADLAAQGTNLGVQNSQFWLPQMLSNFGMLQGMGMANQQSNSTPYSGQGVDFSALANLFGQGNSQQPKYNAGSFAGWGNNKPAPTDTRSLGGGWSGGWK